MPLAGLMSFKRHCDFFRAIPICPRLTTSVQLSPNPVGPTFWQEIDGDRRGRIAGFAGFKVKGQKGRRGRIAGFAGFEEKNMQLLGTTAR